MMSYYVSFFHKMFIVTRSMTKYVGIGATTRFFNCYVGIDKHPDLNMPQSTVELFDFQNDDDSLPDIVPNELNQATEFDDMAQDSTIDDEISTTNQRASTSILGKENRLPDVINDKERRGKKPFQLKGRLPQGISVFKRSNANDSRHFSFSS